MMPRLNRLTVSPRAHQRGHGFRPDGELVALIDFEGYWARWGELTPIRFRKIQVCPKDHLTPPRQPRKMRQSD
jgi:hypothetical protein